MSDNKKEKYENRITIKLNSSGIVSDSYTILPIIDAHMHIQSNDIAPLPIMNGILRYNICKKGIKGKKINFLELSFRDLEEDLEEEKVLCDYNPDTTKIYYNGEKIKTGLSFSFDNIDIDSRKFLSNAAAGFAFAGIEPLTFFVDLTKYGKIARHPSYIIAGLYQNEVISSDLGYSSRNSNNKDIVTKIIDKENFLKATIERKLLTLTRKDKILDKTLSWYNYETAKIKEKDSISFISVPKCACIMGMELMYAHYWGIYGIPLYISFNNNIYTVDNFPTKAIHDEDADVDYRYTLNYPYDIDISNKSETQNSNDYINDFPKLKNAKFFKEETKNKYSIFLKKIPEKEKYQYEDFETHLLYQKMSALKYPLYYLPFYHFDPRRFFSPIEKISKNFNFYIKEEYDNYRQYFSKNEDKQQIDSVALSIEENENSFSCKMNIQDLYNELLVEDSSNDGLFWGIKLYVALGYPPYIGSTKDSIKKKIFPRLSSDDYKEFSDFLNYCAKKNVPITCHASPQGMTIADSEIYLKEFLKNNPESKWTQKGKSNFEPSTRGMLLGFGLIDDFSSSVSWEIALENIDFKDNAKLTLCLAHFGGKDFFKGDYSILQKKEADSHKNDLESFRGREYPYSWQNSIAEFIQSSKHNIYTDLSNFMFNKVDFSSTLASEEYNKLYKNSSNKNNIKEILKKRYSINDDFEYETSLDLNNLMNNSEDEKQDAMKIRFAMLENGIVGKDINEAAENLAQIIKDYPKLKYRIMYGTDYPLFETTVHGVANYQASTFIFYQLLTHKLENKWDAWHQFCVINPLKFLGLITENIEDDSATKFKLNTELLKKMANRLKNFNEKIVDEKNREKNYGLDSILKITEDIEKLKKGYENEILIPNSNLIKSNNQLIITGNA